MITYKETIHKAYLLMTISLAKQFLMEANLPSPHLPLDIGTHWNQYTQIHTK